ncbi:Retrovirus-related Pol polyprotein from transposon TNT 1-94 [Vitis vinifera]|uniref:Retrovirus-related Pol polyprotein from transposon TNT 1-94 n=1 Tax=Vitis vinifera TaxID=29760 RepID=A0A438HIT5_VITVI|nr:Retrovirus-related Pol polyprotein from transposon TNT 1-94 [Vitis vinifera]
MSSTSEGQFAQPAIPRFNGHYDHWSMLMENFLRSKEYWSLVETGYDEPQANAAVTEAQQKRLDEIKLKDLKVKNYLFQAIDRTILETILQKNTSKQIWDSMKKKYEGNARVKRSILQALRRDFETLEMKSGECITDYFSRVMSVNNKMRFHGEQMREVTIVEKILRSLTDNFNYIVCSIEESKDTDTLTIDELQSSLIAHEQKFHKKPVEEQALKVTTDERIGAGGRGRNSYRGKDEAEGVKPSIEPQWNATAVINWGIFKEHEAMCNDVWFLDSDCSNHMCGDARMFSELDESFKQQVKLENNSRITVKGRENVRLQLNGFNYVLTAVFYVPELKNNLLSIGQLQEKGLAIMIHDGLCKIYHPDKGLIIQTAMSTNRMFTLLANKQEKKEVCFQASAQELYHLWHRRYGHLSHKGLNILQTNNMVRGLPHLLPTTLVCIDCLNEKQHRDPIPKKSAWKATKKLQLIHADICGPVTPHQMAKREALNSFKCFKRLVEKETGMYIKCLRTDRGEWSCRAKEPDSDEYGSFNALRKEIPKTFWPETVNWTMYVLNRSPTVAVKNVTPEEAWSGVKPTIEHFRVFGCVAHVHVPDAKRTKLDNKSLECVLLGFSDESKGYKLYDPVAKKVVTSIDIVFEEDRQWEWDTSYEEQVLVDLEWGDDDKNDTKDNEGDENLKAASEGNEEAEGNENQAAANDVGDAAATDASDAPAEGSNAMERRVRRAPIWMEDYISGEGLSEGEIELNMALVASTDPINYEEAVMTGAKTIGVKWIYKTKLNELGEVDKCKARLVAKGYSQQQGVDFTEIYAPVARMDTVRMIVALAAQRGWTIYQLDVKSAFLHGELSEDVYVDQPKVALKLISLVKASKSARMSRLYSPRGAGQNSMMKVFDMTDLGRMRFFLGIEVLQKSDGIFICQRRYVIEVLKRFGMFDSKPFDVPHSNSSRYMFSVSLISRGEEELLAFTDSDYAGDIDDRKSMSGYVFLLSSGNMDEEMKKLSHEQKGCTTIMCDNSSTIKLSRNQVMHGRSKHIDVRFHFLRDLTKDGVVELIHC